MLYLVYSVLYMAEERQLKHGMSRWLLSRIQVGPRIPALYPTRLESKLDSACLGKGNGR